MTFFSFGLPIIVNRLRALLRTSRSYFLPLPAFETPSSLMLIFRLPSEESLADHAGIYPVALNLVYWRSGKSLIRLNSKFVSEVLLCSSKIKLVDQVVFACAALLELADQKRV